MYIFSAIITLAILLLLGNLARLAACTWRVWKLHPARIDRFKAVMLLLAYCAITAPFVYCGVSAICEMLCPTYEVLCVLQS